MPGIYCTFYKNSKPIVIFFSSLREMSDVNMEGTVNEINDIFGGNATNVDLTYETKKFCEILGKKNMGNESASSTFMSSAEKEYIQKEVMDSVSDHEIFLSRNRRGVERVEYQTPNANGVSGEQEAISLVYTFSIKPKDRNVRSLRLYVAQKPGFEKKTGKNMEPEKNLEEMIDAVVRKAEQGKTLNIAVYDISAKNTPNYGTDTYAQSGLELDFVRFHGTEPGTGARAPLPSNMVDGDASVDAQTAWTGALKNKLTVSQGSTVKYFKAANFKDYVAPSGSDHETFVPDYSTYFESIREIQQKVMMSEDPVYTDLIFHCKAGRNRSTTLAWIFVAQWSRLVAAHKKQYFTHWSVLQVFLMMCDARGPMTKMTYGTQILQNLFLKSFETKGETRCDLLGEIQTQLTGLCKDSLTSASQHANTLKMPQPVTMQKEDLAAIEANPSQYLFTLKLDGARAQMILLNNVGFIVSISGGRIRQAVVEGAPRAMWSFFPLAGHPENLWWGDALSKYSSASIRDPTDIVDTLTLLDGELIRSGPDRVWSFFAYDCYIHKNTSIGHQPFTERYDTLRQSFGGLVAHSDTTRFGVKNFCGIENLDVQLYQDPSFKISDGIIINHVMSSWDTKSSPAAVSKFKETITYDLFFKGRDLKTRVDENTLYIESNFKDVTLEVGMGKMLLKSYDIYPLYYGVQHRHGSKKTETYLGGAENEHAHIHKKEHVTCFLILDKVSLGNGGVKRPADATVIECVYGGSGKVIPPAGNSLQETTRPVTFFIFKNSREDKTKPNFETVIVSNLRAERDVSKTGRAKLVALAASKKELERAVAPSVKARAQSQDKDRRLELKQTLELQKWVHRTMKRAVIDAASENQIGQRRPLQIACMELAAGVLQDTSHWTKHDTRHVFVVDGKQDSLNEGVYRLKIKNRILVPTNVVPIQQDLAEAAWLNVPEFIRHDVITCFFALHFFCKNEATLTQFVKNAARRMPVGGLFCAIFPAGDNITELLGNLNKYESKDEGLLKIEKIGNSENGIVFTQKAAYTEEGSKEYLVDVAVLIRVAGVCGLKIAEDVMKKVMEKVKDNADKKKDRFPENRNRGHRNTEITTIGGFEMKIAQKSDEHLGIQINLENFDNEKTLKAFSQYQINQKRDELYQSQMTVLGLTRVLVFRKNEECC